MVSELWEFKIFMHCFFCMDFHIIHVCMWTTCLASEEEEIAECEENFDGRRLSQCCDKNEMCVAEDMVYGRP